MSRLSSVVFSLCVALGLSQCVTAGCPTYWTSWGNHCYRYFGDEVSWTEAVNFCRLFSAPAGTRGFADLVSIHSRDEHDFLYSYWRSVRQHDSRTNKPGVFIGLTDFEENGVFKWSDGTAVDYTNFDIGQDTAPTQYRYLMWDWSDSSWNPQGKWHDVPDSTVWYFQFMCKMPYGE